MAEPANPQPIVIKKIKKTSGGGHGAAWKIAYADFVTAMMAFFLLMWLLGSTTKAQLEGIAEYFKNPMKVSMAGGSGAGDATSVIQGGGTDLTRTVGQVRNGSTPGKIVRPNTTTVQKSPDDIDRENLKKLKAALDAQIEAVPALKAFQSQLLIDITRDGLRIQIVDSDKRPMFSLGGITLEGYAKTIFEDIAPTLNHLPNAISITGHTDALQYQSGGKGYSNFDLSSGRANAVRKVLVQSGLEEQKVLRVIGMGSTVPFDKDNPNSPQNRRVSIVVLTREAEKRILGEQGIINQAMNTPQAEAQIAAGSAPGPAPGASHAVAVVPAHPATTDAHAPPTAAEHPPAGQH